MSVAKVGALAGINNLHKEGSSWHMATAVYFCTNVDEDAKDSWENGCLGGHGLLAVGTGVTTQRDYG